MAMQSRSRRSIAGWTCADTSETAMNSPDARCAAVSSPGTRNAPRPTLRPLAVAKPALFAACCVPFATLALSAFEVGGGLGLGPNPIEALIHGFGEWGLRLLLATLALSPLRAASGAGWVLGLRRMLGLFAFGYLALHFLTWLVFDRWLDAASIVADIAKRPYITVGFVGLTLL